MWFNCIERIRCQVPEIFLKGSETANSGLFYFSWSFRTSRRASHGELNCGRLVFGFSLSEKLRSCLSTKMIRIILLGALLVGGCKEAPDSIQLQKEPTASLVLDKQGLKYGKILSPLVNPAKLDALRRKKGWHKATPKSLLFVRNRAKRAILAPALARIRSQSSGQPELKETGRSNQIVGSQ